MSRPLMPKATALWLIRHTSLTWDQIGHFCGLHPLVVSVLGENQALQELDPVMAGQLTREEITRCEMNPQEHLQMKPDGSENGKTRRRYIPLSKRAEVPHAVLWIVRHYPDIPDSKICALLATTKPTVKSIREGNHWNIKNFTPKDPVALGLCSQEEWDRLVAQ